MDAKRQKKNAKKDDQTAHFPDFPAILRLFDPLFVFLVKFFPVPRGALTALRAKLVVMFGSADRTFHRFTPYSATGQESVLSPVKRSYSESQVCAPTIPSGVKPAKR